jgi:nucleotide sugar dehydrogenase
MDKIKIAVIGLGYVGLPLAKLLSTKYSTIGYDISEERVNSLIRGHDVTLEISSESLRVAIDNGLQCTTNIEDTKDCNVYIVTVPTPIDCGNRPDLGPLLSASRAVGSVISRNNIVIYESTVYPGMTEEICIPEIERVSGMKFNTDFFAGYSPERINPGDKEYTVEKIKKVTSGSTPHVARIVDDLYNSILVNGTYRASSIRIAEASKIIENTQRDVNIALMNELAKIFNAMGIDTQEIIDAASSKWNFLRFKPGLVGGHCISVDPYYLIEKAKVYGVLPRIMMDARRLNDGMGYYIGGQVLRLMNKRGILVKNAAILILGITFKENCPDIRNTKVIDVYLALHEYTANIMFLDPWADAKTVEQIYKIKIHSRIDPSWYGAFDVIISAVAHEEFKRIDIQSLLKEDGIVYDVKGNLDRKVVSARL